MCSLLLEWQHSKISELNKAYIYKQIQLEHGMDTGHIKTLYFRPSSFGIVGYNTELISIIIRWVIKRSLALPFLFIDDLKILTLLKIILYLLLFPLFSLTSMKLFTSWEILSISSFLLWILYLKPENFPFNFFFQS